MNRKVAPSAQPEIEVPAAHDWRTTDTDEINKRRLRARNVSHSNIKTIRWQNVNVQRRRIFVPELKRFITLKVTTADLRTIDKIGLLEFAKRHSARL